MTSPNTETPVKPPASRPGTLWERLQQSVGSTTKKLLGTGGAVVVVAYASQRLREPDIVLVPVSLPHNLAESGLSASELTQRLLDRIQALRDSAEPTASESGWGIEKNIAYPDVEILGVKWLWLKTILDGVGHQSPRVTWEISARPREAAPATASWIVTASTTGGRLHQHSFRTDDPDSALSAIAVAVLEDVEPNVAIRMHRFRGECDDARHLAIRQYNHAHTAAERSAARNMMGFVSECPFATTGANGDDAETFYRQAIALDSMNAQAHSNLARLLADRGDSADDAVWRKHFELAAARAPNLASTYEAWGKALLRSDDKRGAVEKLKHAVDIDPTSPTAHLILGSAYLYRGDTSQAIEELRTALLQKPDAAALSQYARLLMQRRRWVAAADAYRRASELEANDLEVRFRLGVALDSGARKAEARAVFLALADATADTTPYCNGAKRYVPDLVQCGHPARLRQ